jgi:catechol 2,3-dioxygenase-like lactoylglutathione lyase family enzyme
MGGIDEVKNHHDVAGSDTAAELGQFWGQHTTELSGLPRARSSKTSLSSALWQPWVGF